MNPYNSLLTKQVKACINGEASSKEENDRLYPLVAAGDQGAIKQMIESNVPLVINKVESLIRCCPGITYLRDDLVAEGCLGLTKAVNKMAEAGPRDNPNATGFISYWIHYHVGIVVDGEAANGASPRTLRQKADDGEEILHKVELNEFMFTEAGSQSETIDPMSMPDLEDLIDACCESETDRTIVAMRAEGRKDKEIATALGLPLTTTFMARRAIYGRFLEKSGMAGEV